MKRKEILNAMNNVPDFITVLASEQDADGQFHPAAKPTSFSLSAIVKIIWEEAQATITLTDGSTWLVEPHDDLLKKLRMTKLP